MVHFEDIEKAGATLAVISDLGEGDCAWDGLDRPRFLARCGVAPGAMVAPKQVHGCSVLPVNAGTAVGEADGLITDTPGLPLGIAVADCVPLFLYDPHRGAGGLIHAGRAGTRGNIAAAAVRALEEHYGCVPAHLRACVGPSAGPCCYKVSPELAEDFRGQGLPVRGRNLDLWGSNRQQLEAAGLMPDRIHVSEVCTICGDGFHSYRRGHRTERNLAVLVL